MKLTKISVKYGTTISTGYFENVRIEAELEGNIEEGEDYDSAWSLAWDMVKNQVRQEVRVVRGKLKKRKDNENKSSSVK